MIPRETPLARLSVPGNLLLLGEYAVVEPGGLGIALAIEPRVSATARGAAAAALIGIGSGGETRWPGDGGLLSAVADAVAALLEKRGMGRLPAAEVRIDSRSLRKGYGSSAAVAVAASAMLLALAGLKGDDLVAATSHAALTAHRAFQGGRGSGYDVAASLRGGVGLFEGGEEPSWTILPLDWIGPLAVFGGRSAVATAGAVATYQEWKRRDPAAASDFLAASNRAVAGFASAPGWAEAEAWFEAARALGLELGRAIGVSAEIRPPDAWGGGRGRLYKAVGAGNELGVLVGAGGDAEAARLRIAEAGLMIEEKA